MFPAVLRQQWSPNDIWSENLPGTSRSFRKCRHLTARPLGLQRSSIMRVPCPEVHLTYLLGAWHLFAEGLCPTSVVWKVRFLWMHFTHIFWTVSYLLFTLLYFVLNGKYSQFDPVYWFTPPLRAAISLNFSNPFSEHNTDGRRTCKTDVVALVACIFLTSRLSSLDNVANIHDWYWSNLSMLPLVLCFWTSLELTRIPQRSGGLLLLYCRLPPQVLLISSLLSRSLLA